MMPSQEVDRAQVRAYLSAEMWVPCPCAATLGRCRSCVEQTRLQLPLHQQECICQGSGNQFLLRKVCDRCRGYGTYEHDYGQASFYTGCSNCGGHQSPEVPNRSDVSDEDRGLGYLFNDSPDALWDAVRVKGWQVDYNVGAEKCGDTVEVYPEYPEDSYGTYKLLAEVNPLEKIFGQAAIELAVARALGWKGE